MFASDQKLMNMNGQEDTYTETRGTFSLTIQDLHFSQAHDNVESDNSAATIVLFARTTTIAQLLDADNFDAYTAWMMSYTRHAAYGNDAEDGLNKSMYSDLCEVWCIKTSR